MIKNLHLRFIMMDLSYVSWDNRTLAMTTHLESSTKSASALHNGGFELPDMWAILPTKELPTLEGRRSKT